jgi:hypothetical protein
MAEHIIPDQTAAGATILASFTGVEEDDLYVWIRRFDSEEARQAFHRDYYTSEHWVNDLKPKVGDLIDRSKIVVSILGANPDSKMQ